MVTREFNRLATLNGTEKRDPKPKHGQKRKYNDEVAPDVTLPENPFQKAGNCRNLCFLINVF